MMVSLVPNREKYEDVYPEDSEDEDSDGPEEDEDDSTNEAANIKAIQKEIFDNEKAIQQASEDRASAASVYAMLEHYVKSLQVRPSNLEQCVKAYIEERRKAFEVHSAGDIKLKALEHERKKLSKKRSAVLRTSAKEKKKAAKEKRKALEKKQRTRQDNIEAKRRLKQDRIEFWPRKVYKVVLSLDTNSDVTPASSRRGSIETLSEKPSLDISVACRIALSLSYITDSAFWYPRYDLSLETPTSTGLIIYRAEYCNTTSETWKDAKMILSTSHTSFQGLGEPIPAMQPWHIRLVSKNQNQNQNQQSLFGAQDATSGALFSSAEIQHKQRNHFAVAQKASEPRNNLFGLGNQAVSKSLFGKIPQPPPTPQQQQRQQQLLQMQQARQMQQPQMQSAFQSQAPQQANHCGGLFGNTNAQAIHQTNPGGSIFGSSNTNSNTAGPTAFGAASNVTEWHGEVGEHASDDASSITIPDLPSLSTPESEWSEVGMTATYDIPGTRTIAPSHTARRHKIASITLKDIHLSYLLVPKLRAAAFLKARIRNTSSISLLKGPAGLTLDGSFLGNTSLPRCSAGEPFSLSLGVDPSLTVSYAKPVVKRSQTGVFQKEGTGVYTRVCTLTNTKSNRAVEALVLDQIPVSEDERLKVDILQPFGLCKEGDSAKTGNGVPVVGKATEKWGTARATLKKAGEVCCNVNLEPSRGVKLTLEYEARFPTTEAIVGC